MNRVGDPLTPSKSPNLLKVMIKHRILFVLFYLNLKFFKVWDLKNNPNLSSITYRTVPYRFPLEHFLRSRSISARRTVFLPKIHRCSAKKFKSANRTVFKIKTALAFQLIYFKSANRSAIFLKQINSKKSVSAIRTVVKNWAFL
jgi:hypothetical protein